jgi:hypothetical protein
MVRATFAPLLPLLRVKSSPAAAAADATAAAGDGRLLPEGLRALLLLGTPTAPLPLLLLAPPSPMSAPMPDSRKRGGVLTRPPGELLLGGPAANAIQAARWGLGPWCEPCSTRPVRALDSCGPSTPAAATAGSGSAASGLQMRCCSSSYCWMLKSASRSATWSMLPLVSTVLGDAGCGTAEPTPAAGVHMGEAAHREP